MQRASSFLSNRRRIRRVLDHMILASASRLRGESEEKTNLDQLASIACWSGEHLVRAWSAIFGQPPLATARRIQLDFASQALLDGELIARVASSCGYGSGQAFAHAFQRQFGMCASEFLKSRHARSVAPMRIVHLAEPLLCLSAPFTGIARDGGHTFDEMLNTLTQAGSRRAEWDVFSVMHADGYSVDLDDRVSFHAAALKSTIQVPVRGLDHLQIPAGTYAVFDRPFHTLHEDPDKLLRDSGWQRRDAPRFHQFITDPARTIPSRRRDRRWIPVAER